MSQTSSFWSRSFTVIRRKVRLNLYFGETKVSEFNQVVEDAKTEIAKVGLSPSADAMFLTANRAGLHFSCWFPCEEEAAADALREKLEQQKWKMAND